MAITYKQGLAFVQGFAAAITENKEYLTQLDSEIGDADHGTNMDRGMRAVVPKVSSLEGADISQLFKTTAMTLISTVGGASGPLYGTLFLALGTATTGKPELSAEDWSQALDAAVAAVRARGKAELQDKTMIDALQPAADSLRQAVQDGATLDAALTACERAGRAGHGGHHPAGGAQGPCQLPGGAKRRASGPRRHLLLAAAGGRATRFHHGNMSWE